MEPLAKKKLQFGISEINSSANKFSYIVAIYLAHSISTNISK